jgi:hypothetical protein
MTSRRVRAAIDLMVFEGRKRADAAEAGLLTDDAMSKALKKSEALAYLRQQQQVLLASAGAAIRAVTHSPTGKISTRATR